MRLKLIEPLRELFKDEVRKLGTIMGIPEDLVWRHPFPGPGIAIRILGEVTREQVDIARRADHIFIEEIKKAGIYREISQAFAALLPIRAVGVMGDQRKYDQIIALRAVTTTDFMTADWYDFDSKFLKHVSNRIVNEVDGVCRVLYDGKSLFYFQLRGNLRFPDFVEVGTLMLILYAMDFSLPKAAWYN